MDRRVKPGDDAKDGKGCLMRIVVHGQQAFGKAVLEALRKRGEDVVAVYAAPEKEGAKADPLKEAALAAKLPVYQPASYRKPEVWEEFKALKPDLQVMAFVTLFVPEEFLNIPTKGTIQYHPSLLPKYRGPSAINWPIIAGETETGLSIFWPDKARIDWGKPWQQIDRLIRGCNPAPGAWTTLDGKTLKIFEAKPLPAKDPKGIAGKMGEIVAVDADGITVVCADGRFKVLRVQADGPKLAAGEFAKAANVAAGAKFS